MEKKYKNDNKTIKETVRNLLAAKTVNITSKLLTSLENEVLTQVLINDKSFSEIGDKRQLTASRVKQIFERGAGRIENFLNSVEAKIEVYTKVINDFSAMEKQLAKYEKKEEEQKIKKSILNSLSLKTQKLLETKICDTNLSARIQNLCQNGNTFGDNIETVTDLVRLNPKELLKFRNCGKSSIKEIEEFLNHNSLSWNMEL